MTWDAGCNQSYEAGGAIAGCTENAVEPWGKSLEELAKNIDWFIDLTFLLFSQN
ncbi:MAG: hypothetical protein QQW96_05095 [Tychonema bourrellyi B0820]|uniref:hypothetical protein n=1 Tax=Tychonema bourrellyi TaxID=54313 RepID=UPI0015D4AA50|nr:hypothetical protein [Tychonema bourrellyi]MDQ2097007.1 hypothetical protein [Tychonema bourrellyi B0820]